MISDFFSAHAQHEARRAIKAIEAVSSAEVVIAVRRSSARYREIDFAFGAFTAFICLVLFLFLPQEFAVEWFPVDLLVSFALGAYLCAKTQWLRRLLTPKRLRNESVASAAKVAFLELGVSRTRGRTGMLIYASTLERTAFLVPDLAVQSALSSSVLDAISSKATQALATGNLANFTAAVLELVPLLSHSLPRNTTDLNELSDNVSVE